jgi:DNA-binding transcriptional MocR family regulator
MDDVLRELVSELAAASGGEPTYVRIADAIARGVAEGRLTPGDRLPTHRTLAQAIGVAVPTVSRAYRTAHERGLILSTVGRGTFVATGIPTLREDDASDDGLEDMAVNAPIRGNQEQELRAALMRMSGQPSVRSLLSYAPDVGSRVHRSIARDWLMRRGLDVAFEDVALTHGGQHALLLALAASFDAKGNGALAVEELTYPGVRSAAQLLGINLCPIAMDDEGVIPEALAEQCMSSSPPKVVYVTPTAQNPTATTLTLARRHQLIELAERFNLFFVEDDVFGMLAGEDYSDPPTIASLAPRRTLYLTSFSKTLSPGLRCGVLAGPPSLMRRVGPLIRATVFNPAPVDIALTMSWIEDGTADRLVAWQRNEAARRAEVTRMRLQSSSAIRSVRTAALHAWVELDDRWTAAEAVEVASGIGVAISPTNFFSVAPEAGRRSVRLCLGNAVDVPALERTLARLLDAWEQMPQWASGTRV